MSKSEPQNAKGTLLTLSKLKSLISNQVFFLNTCYYLTVIVATWEVMFAAFGIRFESAIVGVTACIVVVCQSHVTIFALFHL